jgi:hypothetical protein
MATTLHGKVVILLMSDMDVNLKYRITGGNTLHTLPYRQPSQQIFPTNV